MAIPLPPDRRRAATLRTGFQYTAVSGRSGPICAERGCALGTDRTTVLTRLFFLGADRHAGPLLLEHPDRRRVQRLPAACQPLDQRLLGQAGDVHRDVVFACELGREADVLAREGQVEAGRLPGPLEDE